MTYALDTNTLSFLLRNDESVLKNAYNATNNGHELVIPRMVDYEIQRGLLAKRMYKKLREYTNFCQNIEIGAIDDDVWDKAVEIYVALVQRGKIIEDADILISAYCLVNDCVLVTNNTRHFENIDGLDFVDWKE